MHSCRGPSFGHHQGKLRAPVVTKSLHLKVTLFSCIFAIQGRSGPAPTVVVCINSGLMAYHNDGHCHVMNVHSILE